jgi:uncharacterized membrane protein HdeD (DUF308 family)
LPAGVIGVFSGVLYTYDGFKIGDKQHRKLSVTSLLLGMFEIVLGIMLIVEPLRRSKFFYLAATTWTLVGGFILIGDALRIRRAAQNMEA